MNDTPPLGQLYGHVYLKRGQPTNDNPKIRRRMYVLFAELGLREINNISTRLQGKLGLRLPSYPRAFGGYNYDAFFESLELVDLLNLVTIVANQILESGGNKRVHAKWIKEIGSIFQEENVGYIVDDQGGVHPAVDAEFEHNKASTIKGLGSSRYNGVLTEFEKAYAELDKILPDGKNAMRSAFEAVEILFKLMFPAQRLGGAEIKQHLEPVVKAQLSADKTASHATIKMLAGFSDWVDGVHYYRHGQGEEEPVQPPLSLAVLTVSTAASYLRWLAELDQSS